MKPALIKLNYKFVLDGTATDATYVTLYNNCLGEFNTQMNFLQAVGIPRVIDFKTLRNDLKITITNSLNPFIQNLILQRDFYIPNLTDGTKLLKLKPISISCSIEEGNIQNNTFVLNLYFTTEVLTLIDSLSDKILIVVGDKSQEILEGSEIAKALFINYSENLTLDSYKRI